MNNKVDQKNKTEIPEPDSNTYRKQKYDKPFHFNKLLMHF